MVADVVHYISLYFTSFSSGLKLMALRHPGFLRNVFKDKSPQCRYLKCYPLLLPIPPVGSFVILPPPPSVPWSQQKLFQIFLATLKTFGARALKKKTLSTPQRQLKCEILWLCYHAAQLVSEICLNQVILSPSTVCQIYFLFIWRKARC